jgi:hypothetical protein
MYRRITSPLVVAVAVALFGLTLAVDAVLGGTTDALAAVTPAVVSVGLVLAAALAILLPYQLAGWLGEARADR